MNIRTTRSQQHELDFERIRILYSNVKLGYLGVISSVTMLFLVAHSYSNKSAALYWLCAVVLANIPRISISILFELRIKSGEIKPDNIRPWERYMTLGGSVAYIGFVSVIFLPFGEDAPVAMALCAFTFMIMATGGVLVLSTSLTQIMVYMTLVMLAIMSRFVFSGESLFLWFAIIFFLGYLQLVRLFIGQNRILIENISLKIEHRQFALKDPLTKLSNRRALYAFVEKLIPACERSGETFCLIILDVDHFKQYNDSKGHNAGDELLLNLSKILLECCREEDLVVRYGGEEFLIVLPHTEMLDATTIAERIRSTVEMKMGVTISAGLAEYKENVAFDVLVSRADKALYLAKNSGRNQCKIDS